MNMLEAQQLRTGRPQVARLAWRLMLGRCEILLSLLPLGCASESSVSQGCTEARYQAQGQGNKADRI